VGRKKQTFRLEFAARRNQRCLFVTPPAKMRAMRHALLTLFCLCFGVPTQAQWWQVQTSGLDTNLRGVSVARLSNAKGAAVAVWASGSNGVILKSLDEGKTWQRLHVAGGETLDFRSIQAFDASTAYVMSSGEGEKSRIYKTTDGGETWKLQYTDNRKAFFLDAVKCISQRDCAALGDPIDGRFVLLTTKDGEQWNPLPRDNLPAALPGEGAFAASGTSLLYGGQYIAFGTGGARAARFFHSSDLGQTWSIAETPIASGTASSGIFSIAIGEDARIMAAGGDYKEPNRHDRIFAYSLDEGKSWKLAAQQPRGYRSALTHIEDGRWVAVGPNGEDVTDDFGVHWKHTDSLNLNSVALLDMWTGWAVGPKGTVARFVNQFGYEIHYRKPQRRRRPAASAIAE
jgi:photosystem II stability/assembly factor-like uncharacterized protein